MVIHWATYNYAKLSKFYGLFKTKVFVLNFEGFLGIWQPARRLCFDG